MKNMKVFYRTAKEFSTSNPNNGFAEETSSYITCCTMVNGEPIPEYTFEDALIDNGVKFEYDAESDRYFELDDFDERTGRAYEICGFEFTDESISDQF